MEFQTTTSERGKLLIICENYKYYKYRELKSSGETCWCCTIKKCCAKIYTIGQELTFSKKSGDHHHDSVSTSKLNRQKISNSVKRKALEIVWNLDARNRIKK